MTRWMEQGDEGLGLSSLGEFLQKQDDNNNNE